MNIINQFTWGNSCDVEIKTKVLVCKKFKVLSILVTFFLLSYTLR